MFRGRKFQILAGERASVLGFHARLSVLFTAQLWLGPSTLKDV